MALDDYYRAQQDVMLYESRVTSFQVRVSNIQNDLALWESLPEGSENKTPEIRANIESKLAQTQQGLDDANSDLDSARTALATALDNSKDDATTTIKSPDTTNEPQSDKTTTAAYDDPSLTPGVQTFDDGSTLQTFDDGSTLATDSDGEYSSSESADSFRLNNLIDSNNRNISFGAQTNSSAGATAQWAGTKDLRTILRVPSSYLTGLASGPQSILKNFGGILFPYTPSISYDNQATYTAISPTHSNYTQFFFKNSNVGPITVTGKFTVQNESEAEIWLSVQHLLRSLTKMRFGADANAGAPPPVCRLDAYGDMMLSNVPVVVSSFKTEYPDNVDYIAVKKGKYASSLVPTISALSLTLNLMYSRKEIRDFSVDQWISGKLSNKGYL